MITLKQKIQKQRNLFSYVLICLALMLLASSFLDLPPLIGNWENKAWSIINLELRDNYYPPGAAIALIPFLWAGPEFWPAIYFYYSLSAGVYFKLCQFVTSNKLRLIALIALPANSYLTWLCLTSADQVIELLTLLLFGYSAAKSRFKSALFFGFLLCFTRPAYWVGYLIIIYLMGKQRSREDRRTKQLVQKSAAVWVLLGVLSFNQIVFGSSNLSTSSSDTIFFSHQKYHYLSLPKFDMDVFLKNGQSTNPGSVVNNTNKLEFIEDPKTRGALVSILDNPQRFVFAEIQKLDSYFFPIQKVPNLPGQYELSSDEKSIIIGDERLTWSLTIGHLVFAIYRAFWMLLLACTLSWFALLLFSRTRFSGPEKYLLIPFVAGVIPGLLYYVETRFKICAELLAVPLHLIALQNLKQLGKSSGFAQLMVDMRRKTNE
jgi:hypothetical protein